jgi:hypothetical protein
VQHCKAVLDVLPDESVSFIISRWPTPPESRLSWWKIRRPRRNGFRYHPLRVASADMRLRQMRSSAARAAHKLTCCRARAAGP